MIPMIIVCLMCFLIIGILSWMAQRFNYFPYMIFSLIIFGLLIMIGTSAILIYDEETEEKYGKPIETVVVIRDKVTEVEIGSGDN